MDLDTAWRSTCKALLGGEVGGLADFDAYLTGFNGKRAFSKSAVSGKEVAITKGYSSEAKFISYDEAPVLEKKIAPLDINDLKDADSLFRAAGERAYYSGDILLGKCSNVTRTNKALDSFYVDKCEMVFRGKYAYDSEMVRDSEYIFGSVHAAEDKFQIRCCETWRNQRMFEALRTYTSSDCYYVANLESCQNCIFSFNLRNRRNCIGNLELPQPKYLGLKGKLVAEMREKLAKDRKLDSITDIIRGGASA